MIRRLLALPLLAASLLVLLSGCIGTGKRDPLRLFDLQQATRSSLGSTQPEQLLIDRPNVSQSLDTPRIAVHPSANELRYYAGAAWREPAPQLLSDALLAAFADARAFRAVGRSNGSLSGDLLLSWDLRQFASVYRNGQPQAVIEMQATLIDRRTGVALGSTRIQASEAAASEAIEAVVMAFGQASNQAIDELLRWTRQTAIDARSAGS